MSAILSPPLALAAGAAIALTVGNPAPALTKRWATRSLQVAVVGLGFGMPLDTVLRAGATGLGVTALGLGVTLGLGLLLGRWLAVERETTLLVSAGTGICGGSAIAAVGPAIGARPESMSVALATVFVLNAVALYLFPPIGHGLDLSQHQFAVWAALAIHDTSSVVGAASAYGAEALREATVLKLARALWIVPVSAAAALLVRRDRTGPVAYTVPWFIGFFVLAALVRSVLPPERLSLADGIAGLARELMAVTLFLIGLGLTRATLRQVGARALVLGVMLWVLVGGGTLAAVLLLT